MIQPLPAIAAQFSYGSRTRMAKSRRTRIILSEQDRERLERIKTDPHSILKHVQRATIMLHLGDGLTLALEHARHRNLSACQGQLTLPHGNPRRRGKKHPRQRQQRQGLEALYRLHTTPDPQGTEAVPPRRPWPRPRQHGLRARFLYHRPVPVTLPMGTVPQDQGSRQTPHTSRPARKHTRIHPHHRRKTP